jgi:hypothetical protein
VIEIESNIPAPEPTGDVFRRKAWAIFKSMKNGDSILVPANEKMIWRVHASEYAKVGRQKGYDVKMVSRSVDGGCRIWKISGKSPDAGGRPRLPDGDDMPAGS